VKLNETEDGGDDIEFGSGGEEVSNRLLPQHPTTILIFLSRLYKQEEEEEKDDDDDQKDDIDDI